MLHSESPRRSTDIYQQTRQLVGPRVEIAIGELATVIDNRDRTGMRSRQGFEPLVNQSSSMV